MPDKCLHFHFHLQQVILHLPSCVCHPAFVILHLPSHAAASHDIQLEQGETAFVVGSVACTVRQEQEAAQEAIPGSTSWQASARRAGHPHAAMLAPGAL